MAFYDDMRAMADGLLGDFQQGVIEYVSGSTVIDGATPLDPPVTVDEVYALTSGLARGVSSKFVDGETILATDLMVLAKADTAAAVGDMLRIDGVDHLIVRLDKIPAAGTTVAKRYIVRA